LVSESEAQQELNNLIAKTPAENSKQILKDKFGTLVATDKKSITLFNRESTTKGSPIVNSFNLNFSSIFQAVLKVNLLADQGRILGFIPNEFILTEINVNGARFIPSDPRSSVNVIDRAGQNSLNPVLLPQGENEIAISFNAPIGAGFTSPNAEITAILIIDGKESPFSLRTVNTTQIQKDLNAFIKDNTPLTIALAVLLVIALIAIAITVTRVGTATSSIAEITSEVKG
jgi:hypothetical protein